MTFYKSLSKKTFIAIALAIGICHTSFASKTNSSNAWASIEYLHWWAENSPISVPLITQNNNPAAFGFINEPGTQIIFGSGSNKNSFNFSGISGGHITIGSWIDRSHQYGIEGNGFALSQAKNSFSASSIDSNIPIINIPFYSLPPGKENVLVARFPNTASVSDTLQSYGAELNGLYNPFNQMRFPITFLMGFRYFNIHEGFELNDAIIDITPNSIINVRDSFSTKNNFYGVQTGARDSFDFSKLTLAVSAQVALGINYQNLIINGQTNIDNQTIIQSIGLFAEPSNIGTHKNNSFAVMPELRIKLGYNINQYIRPFIAYDCLYINNVIRPGQQIDRNINLSQNSLIGGTGVLSGPAYPAVRFNSTGMWMQGVSLGLEIRLA